MVPPPAPHHYHRLVEQRAAAYPGYLGHHHQHQQCHHQQPPLYFHTPVVPPSVPFVPTPPLPPTTTTVGEPFERADSYDVSQDFEQLSIDELQRALDTELEDGTYDDDVALCSHNATATAGVEKGSGDEEFVHVERTDSMAEMNISDLAMSPAAAKDSLPQETREVITQPPSQESTQDIVQAVSQPTAGAVPQGAISTQESIVSPIITQQGLEDALMIQCGQSMEQEIQEPLQKQTQPEAVQETEKEETVGEKQPQDEDTPQVHDEKEIPVSDLSTLSPQMQQHLSPSPSRDHPPPENDLPPAQRRRIIVDEEESNRSSDDMVVDGDYAEDLQLPGDKQGKSSAAATAHVDQLSRRSISYKHQDSLDRSSRILRDITDTWAAPREDPRSTVPLQFTTTRSSTSPSSSTRSRPVVGSGMGLAAEVFRVLNQNQFHKPHNQQQDRSSRRRSSEPGQHSSSRRNPVRSSGRFNPLPMRVASSMPTSATTASSPLMQPSVAASSVQETPIASPPASSSDEEADAADADQMQERQQQPVNAELANFLALTQNPPAYLIAEPEPQAFVPFIAYKPRYLKSRRKVKLILAVSVFCCPTFLEFWVLNRLLFYFLDMNAKISFGLCLSLTLLFLSLFDVVAFVI